MSFVSSWISTETKDQLHDFALGSLCPLDLEDDIVILCIAEVSSLDGTMIIPLGGVLSSVLQLCFTHCSDQMARV